MGQFEDESLTVHYQGKGIVSNVELLISFWHSRITLSKNFEIRKVVKLILLSFSKKHL